MFGPVKHVTVAPGREAQCALHHTNGPALGKKKARTGRAGTAVNRAVGLTQRRQHPIQGGAKLGHVLKTHHTLGAEFLTCAIEEQNTRRAK